MSVTAVGALHRARVFLGFLVVLGASSCRRGAIDVNLDRTDPAPKAIPYLGIPVPRSARNYYAYESGLQATMLQLRFDVSPADAHLLEGQLPCRLGAVETGAPEHGVVGTNDRSWYRVEQVKKHRSCEYHHDLRTADFLFDLDDPARVVVYAVIMSD